MSKLKDLAATVNGELLEGEPQKEKGTKKEEKKAKGTKKDESKEKKGFFGKKKPAEKSTKSEPTQKTRKSEPERAPRSSHKALLEAFEYATGKEVNADICAALKGEPISADLRRLLEVLVDNDTFRQLLMIQYEVKVEPEPEPEYEVRPVYRDVNGDELKLEFIKALQDMRGGSLEDFNIETKFYRFSKESGKRLEEATPEEAQAYLDKNSK